MALAVMLSILTAAGWVGIAAGSANAACGSTHFCAYDGYNLSGTKLLDSGADRGSRNIFPSSKNATSSGINHSNDKWCGVDEHTFVPDVTVVIWGPGDRLNDLRQQGHDNEIDHFDVVAPGNGCPA